jgi:[ribosomal protein S5]-alanine N-acetyltransferase
VADSARVIHTERLDLALLSGEFLDACLAGQRDRARQVVEFTFHDAFPNDYPWIARRRNQVLMDPSWEPWSVRAIVLRNEHHMVGFTSFHGPPGINNLGAPSAAEVGYTVFSEFRCRGYATETCRAMLEWASSVHGVRHFISATEASNAPSLRVIEKLAFKPLGIVVDGETVFELRLA